MLPYQTSQTGRTNGQEDKKRRQDMAENGVTEKVRDNIYLLGSYCALVVATDRACAFSVGCNCLLG